MKITFKFFIVAAFTFMFAAPAMAQDSVKVKEINFDEDRVLGELHDANFLETRVNEGGELVSLVRSRADFVDRLMTDVQDLGE